jgi:hypothetical protein
VSDINDSCRLRRVAEATPVLMPSPRLSLRARAAIQVARFAPFGLKMIKVMTRGLTRPRAGWLPGTLWAKSSDHFGLGLLYLPLRKGVADMHRRAQISQKINERYLHGLATVAETASLAEMTKDLSRRASWRGRPIRALNPFAAADVLLLESVNRGEFLIHGFRNRDLRPLLFPGKPPVEAADAKRQSARVTRLLTLLRAHGIIAKVPKTHRYQVTNNGRSIITALLAARQADTKTLLQAG